MKRRIHFWIKSLGAGCIGIGLALVVSLLLDAEREREAFIPPVTVFETRLAGVEGRTVWLEFRAIRHRDCALAALTQWQNRHDVIGSKINENRAILAPGEESWVRLELNLPPTLRPGNYRVRSIGEYTCPDGNVFSVPTAWLEVKLS